MTTRRAFVGALLAAPAVAALLPRKGEAGDLPLMLAAPHGYDLPWNYDGFCLTIESVRSDWREHGVLHRLRSGDPYPEGFTEGWVAHGHYDGEWMIRWYDGSPADQGQFRPLALGWALYNLERAPEAHDVRLRYTTQEACAALVRARNRPWWKREAS